VAAGKYSLATSTKCPKTFLFPFNREEGFVANVAATADLTGSGSGILHCGFTIGFGSTGATGG